MKSDDSIDQVFEENINMNRVILIINLIIFQFGNR